MRHVCKLPVLILCLVVGLVSVPAWAANTLLSSQKLMAVGDDLRLEIEFNQAMNFLTYFPGQRGTQLVIKMRPLLMEPTSGLHQTIKDELQVERRADNPVREVNYEQDGAGNGLLTVRFASEVQFVVEPVRDQRTINIILVNAAQRTAPAAADKSTESDLPIYVINLQTDTQPINADAQPMLKNFRPKYAIYTISSSDAKETVYQLRLGYFHSQKLAAENVKRLKPFYPKAWVDRVTPEYRLRAENWFLQQGSGTTHSTQNFRVKETVTATQPPATTSTATEAVAAAASTGGAKLTTPVITPSTTTPDATLATTTPETTPPAAAAAGVAAAAATTTTTPAAPGAPAPSTEPDTDSKIMTTAKQAMVDKDYHKASSYLTHILQDPTSTEHQEAQELLGLAYERRGLPAQARAEYEKYLQAYPTGPDADRVRQRLDGLLTANSAPVDKLKTNTLADSTKGAAPGWGLFGNLSQYFRYQQLSTDITSSQTIDNSVSTSLVLSGRKRGPDWDQRIDFAGNYFYNLLDKITPSTSDNATIYSMFYDLSDKSDDISMRLGRQTHSSDGVLTRFDGITLNKRIGLHEKLSVLAGFPVDFTYSDSLTTDRNFYAVSMKFESLFKNLDTKVYFMHQNNDGLTDREAVGNETQYVRENISVYFMYDYDIFYKQTNLATFIGNWRTADNSSFNITADYRNNPLLTTTNALIGQTATTLEQLQQTFTLPEVHQLARDRTGVFHSLTLSATKPLSPSYQLNGDITVSSLDGTPASGGVAAIPATGNLYYYNLTLVANNLLFADDVAVMGARYYTDVSADTIGLNFSDRFNLNSRWRLNPRLSLDMRSGDDGSERFALTPRINAQWRPSRTWQLEMEFAYQIVDFTASPTNIATPSHTENSYYTYIGYNYNF